MASYLARGARASAGRYPSTSASASANILAPVRRQYVAAANAAIKSNAAALGSVKVRASLHATAVPGEWKNSAVSAANRCFSP